MTSPASRRLAALLSTLVTLGLGGCQTYTAKTQDRDDAIRAGDFVSAAAQADKDAEKNRDNKDTVLYRLEQGAILRAAALAEAPVADVSLAPSSLTGQSQTAAALASADPAAALPPRISYLTRSLAALDEAERRIALYDEQAKIRVGSEAGALFTNQANLPYRGRAYDRVMLHTYQALNYLELADHDAARVSLNRALQAQRDAVAANAEKIAEAERLAREAGEGKVADEQGRKSAGAYDVDRAKRDPRLSAGLASIEAEIDAGVLPYGDYVNPFTTFLDALVYTYQGVDASDLERARKSWERVVSLSPGNPHARLDYLAVEPDHQASVPPSESVAEGEIGADSASVASATSVPPVAAAVAADAVVAPLAAAAEATAPAPHGLTYVIHETGTAPYRDQTRIDLPLFLVTGRISYVGMALPKIVRVGGHDATLRVFTSDGRVVDTALVSSMDSVVARDFKNEWPTILTKTIIATATKATIDAVIQKQIEDQGGAALGLLAKVATAALQASVNIADTRTWRSLPKEFHYARLATPADRVITVGTGARQSSVRVEQAAVTVVYVKTTSAGAPLLVSSFVLKP